MVPFVKAGDNFREGRVLTMATVDTALIFATSTGLPTITAGREIGSKTRGIMLFIVV